MSVSQHAASLMRYAKLRNNLAGHTGICQQVGFIRALFGKYDCTESGAGRWGMSDREAFEHWYADYTGDAHIRKYCDSTGRYQFNAMESAWQAWQAALKHSESEPVAWMSPNKQSLEFSRPDTVYGSHTIPLYASPQPVVPEAEALARMFHETYESLAEVAGYETRLETRSFNLESPNGRLMVLVCAEIRKALLSAGKGGE
jgi:hypothetical protein